MRNKLLALALLEGGLVMLLETISPIIVAPILGHSVMIWAAMLSLSVGALAVGYFLGSRFTRKEREYAFLMKLFSVIGAFILVGWGLLMLQNYGPITFATPLFSWIIISFILVIPLILFGSSTPVIVSIICRKNQESSNVTGTVFSISTVGGIFFSILTGFYLIDSIGVSKTVLIALVLTLVLPLLYHSSQRKRALQILNVTAILIAFLFLIIQPILPKGNEDFKLLHFSEGVTGQLIVSDHLQEEAPYRMLMINRMGQTRQDLATGNSQWSYVTYLLSAASMYPKNSRTLVLGLGGGILPHQIKQFLGHQVEAVELDERIIELSNTYFNPKKVNVRKIADDARRYVKRTIREYNYIVLDIFNGEIMPSHGLSKDAFQDLDKILAPNGLIAVNFNGFLTGENGVAGRSLLKTMKAAGFKVKLFDCSLGEKSEEMRNMLYFAYKEKPEWETARVKAKLAEKEIAIENYLIPSDTFNLENDYVITDDKPLMEYLNRKAAKSWRKSYLESYTNDLKQKHQLPLVK